MPLALGTRIGPYEVLSLLGAGGMGEVYLANDSRLHRRVALKILPAAVIEDAAARRRLLAEARLGARLDHPNICAIYEVGEHEGRDYISMQLIQGVTLHSYLDGQPLAESAAIALAVQIADALDHAHTHGVVHRDLKSQNVMVTSEGRAVVLDFGIARAAAPDPETAALAATQTYSPTLSGTPTAMSPEQARGLPPDARSDVFSFGALLYQMWSGREPFARGSTADTLAAVLREDPPPLTEVAPHANPEIERIVRKCLEKDRDLRYASMRDVRIDLERLRRDTASGAVSTSAALPSPSRRRFGMREAVAALLIGAMVVAAALWASGWFRSTPAVQEVAVLPFRSLTADAQQNYLGLGIADAVISRLSQGSALVVRPTSAVRRYAAGDVDASRAAGQLKVDAVLEGTWQREGDRLRVTANLLRANGESLWSDRFDAKSNDIFDIQDEISEQLATQLRTRLSARAAAPGGRRGTRNVQAYEAYTKGLFYFSERGYAPATRQNSDVATQLFEQAVRLDPDDPIAHAQLAYAYVWTALFVEEAPGLIQKAQNELATAERLDPSLGMVPFVRSQISFSRYMGWRMEDAIRDIKRAQKLGSDLVYDEIAAFYLHLGLENEWRRSSEQAIARDPTNQRIRRAYVNEAFELSLPELGRKLQKELLNEEPDVRYWSLTGDLARTVEAVEKERRDNPEDPYANLDFAGGLAMQKHCGEADSLVRVFAPQIERNRSYHHVTFQLAQTYAICGNAREAVHWLEETVDWGFPCYPLFERDAWLEPIRKSPEFVAFMKRLHPKWELYVHEARK